MGKPMPKLSVKAKPSSSHASNPVGDFFKGLGNAVVASSNKTNEAIKTTFTSPEAMKGYKIATNVAIGVVSLTPVGKLAVKGAIEISDKVTGGKATDYLGAQNSTIGMLPGGVLAQAIMGSVDPNAQAKLNQYDPKKAIMNDVKTVAKTTVTHPASTLSVASSVTHKSVQGAKQSLFSPPATHSTVHQVMPVANKPSIFGTPSLPMHTPVFKPESTLHLPVPIKSPAFTPLPSTLAPIGMSGIPVLPALPPLAPMVVAPPTTSVPSTLSATSTLTEISTPTPLASTPVTSSSIKTPSTLSPVMTAPVMTVPAESSSSSMMLPLAGGLLLALFFIMKR